MVVGLCSRGCASLTPGCVLAPIQGAGGGDDWMLWGGCVGFAVSDGAEEGVGEVARVRADGAAVRL